MTQTCCETCLDSSIWFTTVLFITRVTKGGGLISTDMLFFPLFWTKRYNLFKAARKDNNKKIFCYN